MIKNIIVPITVFYIVLFGCDNLFINRNKVKIATNNMYVSIIISKINYHKREYGKLPEKLEELINYERIEKILSSRDVQYNEKGFKDIANQIWLIILKDKDIPDTFFVGNLKEQMIIRRERRGSDLKS